MRIAILVTNTDESDFAKRHARDDKKFAKLIRSVRSDWQVEAFWVCKNQFPEDWAKFDGVIIGGSPASVNDKAPWISRLFETINELHEQKAPVFGACFGHQAIAVALGGKVEANQHGWHFGLIDVENHAQDSWEKLPRHFRQYGAHCEQVTKLPKDAKILFSSADCPNAGFSIGDHVYTSQNHPEMEPDFFHALVEEYSDELGHKLAVRARSSLINKPNNLAFAQSIAAFFEQRKQAS